MFNPMRRRALLCGAAAPLAAAVRAALPDAALASVYDDDTHHG